MSELSQLHARYRDLCAENGELQLKCASLEAQLHRLFREHLDLTKKHVQASAERDVNLKQAQSSEEMLRQEITENTKLRHDLVSARGECVRMAAELLRAHKRNEAPPLPEMPLALGAAQE